MNPDLGAVLRRTREERRESLRDVAAAVGVSASMLSQLETGKTQPSVSTLYALVTYYGLSLDSLLGSPRGLPAAMGGSWATSAVQRAEDNPTIQMENGVSWERLAMGGTTAVEPFVVTYAPRASSSSEGRMTRHAGIEYGYLLTGQLSLFLDFDHFVLTQGDSFCFESERPHRYLNDSDHEARGVWFGIGRRDLSSPLLAGFAGAPSVPPVQPARDRHETLHLDAGSPAARRRAGLARATSARDGGRGRARHPPSDWRYFLYWYGLKSTSDSGISGN